MNNIDHILNRLPESLGYYISTLPAPVKEALEEVRIRTGHNVRIIAAGRELELDTGPVLKADMDKITSSLLEHSVYAYENQLKEGYITLKGGHRAGFCGNTVIDNNKIKIIKDISSINIRCSRQIKGSCRQLGNIIYDSNILIVSPPGCGKTTMLRDIARELSYKGRQVAVCDERSEIAGLYLGTGSYDLGPRTDVLDGCPKAAGIMMLIRAMSPQVIITDEIGKKEDIKAVEAALCAGIRLIASMHGGTFDDCMRSDMGPLIEKGVFDYIVFLTDIPCKGTVREVKAIA